MSTKRDKKAKKKLQNIELEVDYVQNTFYKLNVLQDGKVAKKSLRKSEILYLLKKNEENRNGKEMTSVEYEEIGKVKKMYKMLYEFKRTLTDGSAVYTILCDVRDSAWSATIFQI